MMVSKAVKIAAMTGLALAGWTLMTAASPADAGERVTVARNGMVRVALPASAGSVIVANPNIADVNVVDSHTVYVIGRGFGSSAVTILDRAGRPIFDGEVVVTAGARDSVMMYRGNKPSLMVCSNVCQPADDGDQSHSSGGGSNQPAIISPTAASAIGAPSAAPVGPMPGAAEALSR